MAETTPWTDDAPVGKLPFAEAEDSELEDIWWTRWSLLAPYWQGYKRSLLQANFMKGFLLRRLRMSPRDTPIIRGPLDRFADLPLELKFEIFSHAHAIDLYHMSLTCRVYQHLLSSSASFGLWRRAFAQIRQYPPCPPALKEPQWAALMFGPVRCEDCGRFGAQPDIALYRHFCHPCTGKHFLSKQDIIEMFSSHPEPKRIYRKLKTVCQSRCRLVTLQLRPRTGDRRAEKRFLLEHVQQCAPMVIKELELEAEVENSETAKEEHQKLQEWRQERKEKITTTNEHTMITLHWVVDILTDLQHEHRQRIRACLDRCRERMMNLGYATEDINASAEREWSRYFQALATQRMTRKEFRFHKPFLIETVRRRAQARLKEARTSEIKSLCNSYRSNLAPREWLRCPPTSELMKAARFQLYIGQNIDYVVKFPENEAKEIIRNTANGWIKARRAILITLCLEYEEETYDGELDLDLAKRVFVCDQCQFLDERWRTGAALCGWDKCITHMCHPKSNRHLAFEFSKRGRDVVVALMEGLGLDSNTTTAREMDELDLRFFCESCSDTAHRKGVHGKKAYTWTECITHALQQGDDEGHRNVSWACLGSEATSFVKDHEKLSYLPVAGPWGCAHCARHEHEGTSLPGVVRHVKERHSISNVIPHQDIIRFDNRYRSDKFRHRRPFVYTLVPAMNKICKRCPPMSICKLYSSDDLLKHLRSKHDAVKPQRGIDWDKIEIISTKGSMTAMRLSESGMSCEPSYSAASSCNKNGQRARAGVHGKA